MTFPALGPLSRQGSQVPLLPLHRIIPEQEVRPLAPKCLHVIWTQAVFS